MTDDDSRPDPVATMETFRDFPNNTCPASRNVQMCAEALAAEGRYGLLESDPVHVAGSMATVVASLWQARTFLASLGYAWTYDASGMVTWTKADASPAGDEPPTTGPRSS